MVATGGEEIELAGWAIDLTNLVVSPSRFDRNWGDDSYVCRANASYLQGYASRKAPAVNGYPFFQALPVDYTGAVLGFYSASVDDQKDDVHLWWRPTAFVPINAVFDAASDGLQGIIFVLAVPFFCLNSLFNSGNCLDDARNAARDADVITMLESEIPAWVTSTVTTWMWAA